MSETPQDPYGGQPYYGQPQYPQQPYPGQQYPQQYPQQQYGQPYGYPQPYGYTYQYPPPAGDRRPGTATTASVLSFVAGGLLIAAALLLFAGASLLNGLDTQDGVNVLFSPAEFTVDAVINLICAALLITGGVLYAGRRPLGRTLVTIAAAIVVACAIYWITRFSVASIFYALIFSALVVVAVAMAYTAGARAWLAGTKPASPYGT